MPFYDYRCEDCGDFRELRPMTDSGRSTACPTCGAPAERQLSAPFLAGREPSAGTARPQAGGGRGNWRHLCGLGCSHCS